MFERRLSNGDIWFAFCSMLAALTIVLAVWKLMRQSTPPCRDEVRVVPLNTPSFCGQNQHRVVVVPFFHGETHRSMIVHCACTQDREVVRVLP